MYRPEPARSGLVFGEWRWPMSCAAVTRMGLPLGRADQTARRAHFQAIEDEYELELELELAVVARCRTLRPRTVMGCSTRCRRPPSASRPLDLGHVVHDLMTRERATTKQPIPQPTVGDGEERNSGRPELRRPTGRMGTGRVGGGR